MLRYIDTKLRKEFGKQTLFTSKHEILCSIPADHEYFQENFVLENPTDKSFQLGPQFAVSEACTDRAEYSDRGMLHVEGGWPKDINYLDDEQPYRYRRKHQRDETYIQQVDSLTNNMEKILLQNNAVNIYETYFTGLDSVVSYAIKSELQQIQAFYDSDADFSVVKHISWSADQGSKISAAHMMKGSHTTDSFVWDVENPIDPVATFKPPATILCLEFSARDSSLLCSGLQSGQVACWDIRVGSEAVALSSLEVSHQMSCNDVLWMNTKIDTNFFSGGSDGKILWWDMRNLNNPFDVLLTDPIKTDEQDLSRALGVSVLEYEPSMPTRFMAGTENGLIFSCNRKGKTPIEKINYKLECHTGPIYALERNPSYTKTFLTVSDWNARIWTEEIKDTPIMWTNQHKASLTGGVWSPTKCSLFFVSRVDGWIDAWDVLVQQNEPITSIKVCNEGIRSIRANSNGCVIACGTEKGRVYLLRVSDDMKISDKNDKGKLTAMIERECKRERFVSDKLREVKLKMKTTSSKHKKSTFSSESLDTLTSKAEENFFKSIEEQKRQRQKQFLGGLIIN
uniref:CSON003941 protein n=1 Tax=Culicoides sonorensis TaxID=179676 RepID=A0A336MML7_CULSO